MEFTKRSILGVPVTADSRDTILRHLVSYLSMTASSLSVNPVSLVTPNPEQVMLARRDARFRETLSEADIAIPDGSKLVWASHQIPGTPITERIAGVDFMEDLCREASSRGWNIALLGGRGGVAGKALGKLKQKYPGLEGWGEDGPEFEALTESELEELLTPVLEYIITSDVRLVFIGLGAQKQEYAMQWMYGEWKRRCIERPVVFMCVGGSFDFISGNIPRAPAWMQQSGLEWMFRLMIEPWRIGRQAALMTFVWTVLRERRNGRQ